MNPTTAQRILLIDDQESIHEDYRKILAPQPKAAAALDQAAASLFDDAPAGTVVWQGFELDSAYQGQEGFDRVKKALSEGRPYAMAFVDIRMPPGWDGVQTVRKIWEVDPEILVVICSAYSDYSWEEMVAELGRNDRFLILKKPFDNMEVRQCAMVLAERWSVSRTDALTGLLNRRTFLDHLKLEWGRCQRYQFPLSCVMLDLDFFKRVNDDFGHTAGDVVLKIVAQQLQTQCRTNDFVCRHGGEEFCALLPHTDEAGAACWAEHARQAIAAIPVAISDRFLQVTASFGVAQRLATGDRIEMLTDRADGALLTAKRSGRDRVVRSSAIAGQEISIPDFEARSSARAARDRLIQSAQKVVRGATEISQLISSQIAGSTPGIIEHVSKLKESVEYLLTCLHDHVPAVIPMETSVHASMLGEKSAIINGH
jgi:diguanylate cyclase (GGDEF)-like protein